MKKFLVLSTLLTTGLLSAGIGLAAVGTPRAVSSPLTQGTVLNPFTLQVVSATRVAVPSTPVVSHDNPVRPITPIGSFDGEDVRPGPFTPPPRSPYVPPPR